LDVTSLPSFKSLIFICYLSVSIPMKWFSPRQHIVECCSFPIDSLYPLFGQFNSFVFNVVIDRLRSCSYCFVNFSLGVLNTFATYLFSVNYCGVYGVMWWKAFDYLLPFISVFTFIISFIITYVFVMSTSVLLTDVRLTWAFLLTS
jgi:hypothetical protein